MPRLSKTRVCTETDKKKAEIFNHIDDIIVSGRWSEALENLQYLYRNAPSQRAQVNRKLAWLYFEMKNYRKSLGYLQSIIPTNEVIINRMVIESLLQLDKKDQAILHLAKAPLKLTKKRKLLFIIFPELKGKFSITEKSLRLPQITIRCPRCTQFLFFTQNKPKCLFCD